MLNYVMGLVTDAFENILKKSIDLKLWLHYVLILIIAALGFVVILAVFAIPALLVFFALKFSIPAIIFYAIIAVVFVIVFILFDALVFGVQLHVANDYLAKKAIDLGRVFRASWARMVDVAKVRFFIGLIFFVLLVVLMLPVIFLAIDLVSVAIGGGLDGLSAGEAFSTFPGIIGLVIWLVVAFLIYFLIDLLATPFTIIASQIPLFEDKGLKASVKRFIELGKKNYVSNLGFYVLYLIAVLAASLIVSIIGAIPRAIMVGLVPATESGAGAAIGLSILFLLVMMIVSFILNIILTVWATVFESLFMAKIYLLNTAKSPAKKKK